MPDVFAITVGRFYEDLAEKLVDGATRVFDEAGASAEVHDVPGAFELPLAAKYCAGSGRYAGVACLGAVIRGSTPHFDYVAGEASRGIASAAGAGDIPVTFGVLTTDTIEQALERAGSKAGNKGFDAAMAAIELANLFRGLRGGGASRGKRR